MQKILEKPLVKYLLLFYAAFFLLTLMAGILGKLEGSVYTTFNYWEVITSILTTYALKFLFIFGAILLVRWLQQKQWIGSWGAVAIHVPFALSLTFYSRYSQTLLNNWMYGLEDPLTWDVMYIRALLGADYNFFLYFSMVAIVYAYYFFKKQKDYQLAQSQLQTQLLDSKIKALQSQLQPHFLFNALNDIAALVDVAPQRAQDAITDLSEMLRQTLNLKDSKFISLEQEMSLLTKYVDLEKIRYANKLDYTVDCPRELYDVLVPPLILQPIVENAIKHGFSFDHDVLKVHIKVEKQAHQLQIKVSNDGQPITNPDTLALGTGTSNVINRLETLFDQQFEFQIANVKGTPDRVQTSISFPLVSNDSSKR